MPPDLSYRDTKFMHVAYLTSYDASDVRNWSGLGFHIQNALSMSGAQITPIGNLKARYNLLTAAKRTMYRRLRSQTYFAEREPFVLRHFASQVAHRLSSLDCDAVFSPGSLPIAYLRAEKPVYFWADATFAGMVGFYPEFSGLCAESMRNGNEAEQRALTNCRLAFFASEWAAATARNNYDVDPAKVIVIPFGANIECSRDIDDIRRLVSAKDTGTCKLLFLGVEWRRKGGDLSVRVADLLNRQGIRTELHVAGCVPPGEMPDFVKLHGFVSKSTAEGRALLEELFRESHFLILPSRAECYGLVFAEASSFGLPSLATEVGGIPTVVHNGKNGQLFSLTDDPVKYCEFISRVLSSSPVYEDLCLSSFKEYVERLNWTVAGKRVYDLVKKSSS